METKFFICISSAENKQSRFVQMGVIMNNFDDTQLLLFFRSFSGFDCSVAYGKKTDSLELQPQPDQCQWSTFVLP